MRSDGWHLTEDLDHHLARSRAFLHSNPALHTMPLTVTEKVRKEGAAAYGGEVPLFGRLEQEGEVRAAFHQLTSAGSLSVTTLDAEQADALAARLAGSGRPVPRVTSDHESAALFAEAWQRHTGATSALAVRLHLYRLGTLTPPDPQPEGRGRSVGPQDREQLVRWCSEFVETVGELPAVDSDSWANSRFADRHFTFWEAADGTPLSMAASTTMIAGMVRVDPVYTPVRLRGHGYAGAVTVAVTRAALAQGATEVVLFTDPANTTSNALYRRLGYVRITDFAVYDLAVHDLAVHDFAKGPAAEQQDR